MELLHAVLLSVIQAITEWLPVSSSGHLAIVQHVIGVQDVAFDVFLHFASILAVVVVFWRDIVHALQDVPYLVKLVIAMIPIALVGLVFMSAIERVFDSLFLVGVFFIASGIIVLLTRFARQKTGRVTILDSIIIGLLQCAAILPGVSRSGTTISAGLFLGLTKDAAIKFSFLMAVPLILGASILKAPMLVTSGLSFYTVAVSFAVSFLVSVLAIKFLLRVIRHGGFHWFGVYNLCVGIVLLLVA